MLGGWQRERRGGRRRSRPASVRPLVEPAVERSVIEHIFYDGDVLLPTIAVDFSSHPYVTRHVPTPEELARRE